jgi:DNA-binding CsgD family transcriptional regulator
VTLTLRQHQVLHMLASGYGAREGAQRLGIAVGTYRIHLSTLYQVLGAKNAAHAVAIAAKAGLL